MYMYINCTHVQCIHFETVHVHCIIINFNDVQVCLFSCIGLVGLAISYALSVTSLLSGVVTSFTETEKEMVSVERAMQYIEGAPKEDVSSGNQVSSCMFVRLDLQYCILLFLAINRVAE